MQKGIKLAGKVKHVFRDGTLANISISNSDVLCKGVFLDLYPEDEIIVVGNYQSNPLLGKFFQLDYYREKVTEQWVAKWLHKTTDFSPKQIAEMIVDQKGIEPILEEWNNLSKFQGILSFLAKQRIPEDILIDIEKTYKWKFSEVLHDPYVLLHYPSLSFSVVEKIIKQFSCNNPNETKGLFLLENLLRKDITRGHLCSDVSSITASLKQEGIAFTELSLNEKFVWDQEFVQLSSQFQLEKKIAEHIKKRLALTPEVADESRISGWEEQTGFSLAKSQKAGVAMALAHPFCIITGGPGVGKTTTCKCVTDLLGEDYDIQMVAPTGRAAKRAKESTGLPTSTVHRLLEYDGTGFGRNRNRLLVCDVLVIDESSMIDAELCLALLEATPLTTKIIFVGDVDQLPSVGPGQILKDLIQSGTVPVTRLTEIFRQAADSPIISCAYRINDGEMPEIVNHEDFKYIDGKNDIGILDQTIQVAYDLYKEHNPFDVQVLLPMYDCTVGINPINRALQDLLNPNSPSVPVGNYTIREKDKVIQTKNDSQRGIYNGDVGIVSSVSSSQIAVLFQGEEKEVLYSKEEFSQLQLSYAVTVHRSQGSEYPFAIIPIAPSHGMMLQKNLVYTAITRAKKKCWVIYELEAFQKAVSLESVPKRHTRLPALLQSS